MEVTASPATTTHVIVIDNMGGNISLGDKPSQVSKHVLSIAGK